MPAKTPVRAVMMCGMAERLRRGWELLTIGAERPGRLLVALALLGMLSGVGEAAIVVLLVAMVSRSDVADFPLVGELGDSVWPPAALALAAVTLVAATHFLAARLAARAACDVQRNLQTLLVERYLGAPVEAQAETRRGELQELMQTKAYVLAHGAQEGAQTLAAALNLLVLVVVAFAISVWASLALLAVATLAVLLARPFRPRRRRAMERSTAAATTLAVETTETAGAARDLRVFGVVGAAQHRLGALIGEAARADRDARVIAVATPALTRDATVALLVVGLAVVVTSTDVSLPALGAAIVLMLRSLAHAQVVANLSVRLDDRRANLEVLEDRLRAWNRPVAHGTLPCPRVDRVELRGVGFTYRRAAEPALREVDLTLERGEQLGILGRTGAGKSTLALIVLGLLRPDVGTMLVDGTPIEQLRPRAWQARTAWVGQEPHLLTATVAENIRYLRDEIDDARMLEAAREAGLGPELARWPDGLEHHVGAAGARLSGGQRQRVALARALAGEPDLLVLDEPTSALDAHAEAAIRDALERWRRRGIVVVIAHRLSTIRRCDRIAIIEDGRLAALGAPDELAATNDYFRQVAALSAS